MFISYLLHTSCEDIIFIILVNKYLRCKQYQNIKWFYIHFFCLMDFVRPYNPLYSLFMSSHGSKPTSSRKSVTFAGMTSCILLLDKLSFLQKQLYYTQAEYVLPFLHPFDIICILSVVHGPALLNIF